MHEKDASRSNIFLKKTFLCSINIEKIYNTVSQENTPTQAPKKNKWILPVLIFIAAIFIGLFIWQSQQNKELTTYFQEEQVALEQDFRSIIEEYDSLQVVNNYDSLLLQLDVEQQRVAQLLDELETVKATNAVKLREYRKELSTMRRVMKNYVVKIDSLNTLNQELTQENIYVKEQYKAATVAVIQLEEEKEELSKTIAIASQLDVNQLEIEAQNLKGRKMRKLGKTERFKVSFTIAKNITTEVGEKIAYLRITSPKREILPSSEEGQFKFEDAMLDYSAKRQFEYAAEDVSLDIYYTINQFLFAGEYEFDLFVDGVHIAHQTVLLKD